MSEFITDEEPMNDVYRAYCEECDWTIEITDDDAQLPRRYVHGVANCHEAQGCGYSTQVEEPPVRDELGMRQTGRLDSEEELQLWLEEYFEDNGWIAIREVSPHYSSYKADLIVSHDDYGWFGIETKYFEGDGGGKMADAHHQITRKYRHQHYLGEKISLWAVCPYFSGLHAAGEYSNSRQQQGRATLMREFFCRHGIGYIDLDSSNVKIDFAMSSKETKVPVGGEYEKYLDEYREKVDMDHIREMVSRKCERFDYQ